MIGSFSLNCNDFKLRTRWWLSPDLYWWGGAKRDAVAIKGVASLILWSAPAIHAHHLWEILTPRLREFCVKAPHLFCQCTLHPRLSRSQLYAISYSTKLEMIREKQGAYRFGKSLTQCSPFADATKCRTSRRKMYLYEILCQLMGLQMRTAT